VAGVNVDGIVGVLPSLGQNRPRLELLAVQSEIVRHGHRITDLLDHDHIRPEAEDHHRSVPFPHLPKLEAAHHQTALNFRFGQVLPVGRIFIDADQIIVPFGCPPGRPLGRPEREFVFCHEIHVHHVPVQRLDSRVGEDPGEDGPPPELLEIPSEVGQEKAETRAVMPFLHHIQRANRGHRREGFPAGDGKQSAHDRPSFRCIERESP